MRCPGDRVGTSCSPSSAAPVWTQQSCPCPQGGSCIPQQGQGTACPPPVPLAAGTPKPWHCPSSWGRSAGSCCLPKTPSRALHSSWREGGGIEKGPRAPPGGLGSHRTPCPCPQGAVLGRTSGSSCLAPNPWGVLRLFPCCGALLRRHSRPPAVPIRAGGGFCAPSLDHGHRLIAGCGAAGRVETGC